MRTTVNLDEHLLRQAKELAARGGLSLGQIIDDALRVHLMARGVDAEPAPVDLPVFGGSGLQPGVDLEDKDALSELLNHDGTAPRAAG